MNEIKNELEKLKFEPVVSKRYQLIQNIIAEYKNKGECVPRNVAENILEIEQSFIAEIYIQEFGRRTYEQRLIGNLGNTN